MNIILRVYEGDLTDGWPQADVDRLDMAESTRRYVAICIQRLKDAYPQATIDAALVDATPTNGVVVEGDAGEQEEYGFVEQICSDVFFDGNLWAVERARDVPGRPPIPRPW